MSILKRTNKQWRKLRHRVRKTVRVNLNRNRFPKQDEIPIELRTAPLDVTQIEASLCRSSFYEFVKMFWGEIVMEKLITNWHMKYLCQEMQIAAERVFKGEPKLYDEIFNVPPGTSKSTICTVMFSIWVWIRMPSARTICCSFSETLSLRLSTLARRLLKSDKFKGMFPDIELRSDQDTKSEFANTKGGVRFAIGSGTQVMGAHAHFIIIDDPIDPKAVLSDVQLDNINNWIAEQLSGRKVDKEVSMTFLVMQRLAQNDPSAVMGAKKKVKWVKIPATTDFEIYPKGLIKYYKNGLMDPTRLPRTVLEAIQEGPRGDYVLAGQYGQDPIPPGGGMFKTKRIISISPLKKLPRFKNIVRFWDKAGTLGGGAYTVGVKMGITNENRIFLLDVIRVQLDSWEREKLIRQTAHLDGKNVIVGLEQEGGSGGKESVESTIRRLIGYKCKTINPKGKKEERADPFSTQVNSGSVYMVESFWNKDYLEELKYFPFSTYKDQVDASSGCLTVLLSGLRRIGGMRRGSMTIAKKRSKLLRKINQHNYQLTH